MDNFILIFLICVFSISLIITLIGEIAFKEMDVDIDSHYFDENGENLYYDRSLIEKKLFRQKYPHITDIRTQGKSKGLKVKSKGQSGSISKASLTILEATLQYCRSTYEGTSEEYISSLKTIPLITMFSL